MRFAISFIVLLSLGCASQPSQQQIAIWSYFLKQCESEGITDRNALAGCITLKERQMNISSGKGKVLQAMGAALNPQVYQGFTAPPGSQCHITPDYAGGYRTVCQ